MAHPFQVFQHTAVGEMAIIVAVMAQAWEDLDAGPALAGQAAVYFLSGLYRHHLAWLGLPEYWLPEGFDRPLLERMAKRAELWPRYSSREPVKMKGGEGVYEQV